MAATKTCRKIEKPRSASASGHVSSSRDDLLRTVLLSKYNLQLKSQPSSQTPDGTDCSQYLEDYRSYLEIKDRDEIADAQPGRNKPRNGAEKQSKSQVNSGKVRSVDGANDGHSHSLSDSPLPIRDQKLGHRSIGGSIVGQSKWPFANNSPIGRAGSLRSLSSRQTNRQSPDGNALRSEKRFLAKSVSSLQSVEGRSRLPSFGIASVQLKSGRKDEVLKRNSEEASVQTDPELAVNDVQDGYAQTDDVRDDLSYSESEVSFDANKDVESYQDGDRNDVSSDTAAEDFSHDEDGTKSEADRFASSDEDLARSCGGINHHSYPGPLGKATISELDSGIGNTISQDLSSFWEGMSKSGPQRPVVSSSESRRKPQHLFELKDFGQQTVDTQSTQTPLRLRVGVKGPQLKVLGAVSLEDWLMMDSGQEGGVCLEPWPMLGLKEEEQTKYKRTMGRGFATQTFGQVTSVVQVSNETQTNAEEWQGPDQSADLEEDKDLESELYRTVQQNHHHYHHHSSRPMEDRTKNGGRVREDRREDGEDRSSHARTHKDQWDDDLTDEIIQVFKDTRRLIAKAKNGKQPEEELLSGKRQLLEMMLREVKNLKSRVGREEDEAGDVRVSRKEDKRGRRKEPMKLAESDSAIESSEADEDEERRRRMGLLHRSPHDRQDRSSRRTNKDRRHSGRHTSVDRGRRGGSRHHSNLEPDSRHRLWMDGPKRIGRNSGFIQSEPPPPPPLPPPPPTSQESPSQYRRNVPSSHGPRIWSRPIQGPPLLARYPSSSLWHSQQPNNSVALNRYSGQLPHSSVVPAPLPVSVPAASSVCWRHPAPNYSSLGISHQLQNPDRPSLWSGTGQLGHSGAFRPTQTASTVQKPGVVFFPATPAGTVLRPGPGHPGVPGQGHPPVLLPQQGPLSYVPIQSGLVSSAQPSVFLPVQGQPIAVRPTQGQGLPLGPAQQVNESLRASQNPPRTSVQRQRNGLSRSWRANAFEFEKSIKQAALEAEQIKELSNRLLRQNSSPIAA